MQTLKKPNLPFRNGRIHNVRLLACSVCAAFLLIFNGCASDVPDSSQPDGSSSAPSDSVSAPTRPSESSAVATGDLGAFLQFLRGASSAQVFRIRDDRSGYDPLGRVSDRAAFTALADAFAGEACEPLDEFDFGADGMIWLSGISGANGRAGDMWIAPRNGGTAVLFEIADVLPDQRFFFRADMTAVTERILESNLRDADAALLADFAAALEQGDAEQLAALTGGDAETCAALKNARFSCGDWRRQADEENEYVLRVNVLDGGGLLPEGEEDWLIRLGAVGGDGGMGIAFAAPLERAAADEQTSDSLAAGLIRALNLVLGAEPFASVSELDPELLGEAILVQTKNELHAHDDLYDFPGAEARAIAKERFGLSAWNGEEFPFYDAETDTFSLYGRGAAEVYSLLSADETENGVLRVTQFVYADRACMIPEKTLLYTFRIPSEPDGCELISCEEIF